MRKNSRQYNNFSQTQQYTIEKFKDIHKGNLRKILVA